VRYRSSYLLGTFSVRISAGKSDILTEGFRGFSQFLPENIWIIYLFGHNRFLSYPFHDHSSIRVRLRFRVTLRRAVYRQSVRLGDKPFETHDQKFFQLNTCGYSPYDDGSVVYNCFWSSLTQSFSANLEGQVPVFIFPRDRVTRLYPQALISLFVPSDSQDYGGGIRPRLHTGHSFIHSTLYSPATEGVVK
jgi:hypothetical protein